MATQLNPLFVRVGADVKGYMAGMTKVQTTARQTGAKIAAAAKIASFAMLGIGIAAVKMAVDFEKNMANVNTLLGGNSKRIKELGEDVKRMARATGKSLDDLTGGLYQVISAFGDSADAVKILDISAKAAVAGLSTTTEALNLISAVTKGYGDTSAEAAQKAADLAFTTVRLGQTTFPELAASIGKVIPLAAKMGASVEEVNAIFATLTGVTGNAAEVSTQTAALFKAMIKPTEKMKLVIEDLGYGGAEALVGSLGLVPALKAVMGKTDGTVEALGELIPRGEALTALFALTGGSAEKLAENLEEMAVASGASTEAFKIQADTFQNRMDRLVQDISVGLVDLGETLLPMAENVLTWAGNVARLAGEIGKLFEAAGKAADEWIPQWLKDAFSGAGQAAWVQDLFSGGLYTAAGKGTAYWVKRGRAGDAARPPWASRESLDALKELAKGIGDVADAVGGGAGGLTSAFIQFSGAQRDAERTTEQINADLADLALKMEMARTATFDFLGIFDPRGFASPLAGFRKTLDLFSKEIPDALVKGWNLTVAPALAKLPAGTKSSLSADMGDAFIDGFQGAMKNIQDIWKAVTVGLGQAFSVALSKELGTGFWGTFLSSVGGSLISSAIGFIFGGDKKTDLGLPTFAEAQELLAEKAREAAEALAGIKDVIADTNVSIFRAKLSLDQFRDSLQEARKAQRDAARAIRAVGEEFAITQQRTFQITGGGARTETLGTLTGGAALAELQRLIDAAIGTGKLGFISRREQKEILELVQGTENEILAKQLVEAAAATALIQANFELQKLQLKALRDTRKVARATRDRLSSIKPILKGGFKDVVDAIDGLGRRLPSFQTGSRFVPQTGLAILHRGEQVIPARGERGAAGIDAGGGRPTNLTANIFLDGKLVESVVVPVMEDAIASRETSIRVNTRERRG